MQRAKVPARHWPGHPLGKVFRRDLGFGASPKAWFRSFRSFSSKHQQMIFQNTWGITNGQMVILHWLPVKITPSVDEEKVTLLECFDFMFVSACEWKLPIENLLGTCRCVVTMNPVIIGIASEVCLFYLPLMSNIVMEGQYTVRPSGFLNCTANLLVISIFDLVLLVNENILLQGFKRLKSLRKPINTTLQGRCLTTPVGLSLMRYPLPSILQLGLEGQELKAFSLKANASHLPPLNKTTTSRLWSRYQADCLITKNNKTLQGLLWSIDNTTSK